VNPPPMVSIVIVTRNAFVYVLRLFRSLAKTRDASYEVVVVDNDSKLRTRLLLVALSMLGRVHRLCLLDHNTLFAEGNNIGVAAARRDSRFVLLLNSDVEIRDPYWLRRLVEAHRRGVTAFGYVAEPISRADGYCLLVDRDLYDRMHLDEQHQWWWGITRFQAALLTEGHSVQAIREHDDLLIHFGGKSGGDFRGATGMDVTLAEVRDWFDGRSIDVIERL
jgi:glycosyltransferase involved in cell wall biosynthesis